MPSVLTRERLEASPLADLHQLAAELQLDGYRRLRKADLIEALIAKQGGEAPAETPTGPVAVEPDVVADDAEGDDAADVHADEPPKPRSRGRRGGRGRRRAEEDGSTDEDAGEDVVPGDDLEPEPDPQVDAEAAVEADEAVERGSRGRRDRDRDRNGDREERIAEGVVELLANGSGFVRVAGPEPSEDDVYVSAAQVRRCELVNGDRVSGPVRRPRRSERYPSLVRIDTINGAPADEVAEGTPFDELPCDPPSERFAFGSEDPTLRAIEWLTPIGRGSRVVVFGGAGAGKTEALRRLAQALTGQEGLEVTVVLAGSRPEELAEWGEVEVAGAATFAAGPETLGQLVERAVDTARRVAARGGHAVLLIDSLDHVPVPVARRALAAARNLRDGGSLTVIASRVEPLGGESTRIALDPRLAQSARFPALELTASAVHRPDLLVGEAGAQAIADARAKALGI